MEKGCKLIVFILSVASAANVTLISQSICEIIDEFYSKYSRNLDIIDCDGTQSELTSEIMKNLNNSIAVTIRTQNLASKWTIKLENQTILLFDNFWHFNNFNSRDLINIRYISPLKLLVYCVNVTESQLSSLKTDLVIPPYYYFIVDDELDQKIKLLTFENRNDLEFCHERQQLIEINEFSATTSKWTVDPIFPKKYKNFHNCKMVIGIYGDSNFESISLDIKQLTVVASGLSVKVLRMVANQLNFRTYIIKCLDNSCSMIQKPELHVYNVISTTTIDGYAINNINADAWRHVMMNIQCTPLLLVPPSDLYTSYEKMLLPFDHQTWIGLCVVFLSGIFVIFIMNFLPQNIKSYIFGTEVRTPSLNFFIAFFGEAQTRSPNGNFARIIWIFFIFYCLVIRTTYQGKLFEFTTTAVRKPELESLDDLKERNFSLYVIDMPYTKETMDLIYSDVGLPIINVPFTNYSEIYTESIKDPSFTGTVLACDIEHALNAYYSSTPMTNRFVLIPTFTKSFYAFGFMFDNLWNERLQDIINGLITGGIINYHLETMTRSKWNMMPTTYEEEKVVLNMSHLGFGFQICFFSAFLAFLAFLMELLVYWSYKIWKFGWKHVALMVIAETKRSKKSKMSVDCHECFELQEMSEIKSYSKLSTEVNRFSSKSRLDSQNDEDYPSDDSEESIALSFQEVAFGKKLNEVQLTESNQNEKFMESLELSDVYSASKEH